VCVKEKRPLALPLDEVDGLFRKPRRQIGQLRSGVHHIGVREHRERVHIVAIGDTVELIESVIAGEKTLLRAEVPFADCGGPVSPLFHYSGNGTLRGTETLFLRGH
jgi:hypothetical protein